MLRVCVIGMGPIGNLHADIYRADPLAELAGVCDIRLDRMEAASKRLGVPGFPDAETMLKQVKPEICSVCTGGFEYASDHCKPTIQALDAGCHVLCEKPISNLVSEAVKMRDKARERGLCLGVDFNHRFTPLALRAKQLIDEGRLGHPLFLNISMWIGNPAESSPYYHFKALHPHTVDVARYFCGDVEAVHTFAVKAPGRAIWSTAQFNIKFVNGVVGHITGSYDVRRGHPMERWEVAGTGGRIVVQDMFDELTFYPADTYDKLVISNTVFDGGMKTFQDCFRNRIHRFLEQVNDGVAPDKIDGSGADGVAAQRVIDAFIRSHETRSEAMVESDG